MFTLTVKGCQYLIRKGVSQARGLLNNIVEWLQKKDGRYPTSKDIAKEEDATDAKSALLRVKELLKDIG